MTGKEALLLGYKQVSRRFRMIAKIPNGVNPIEFVKNHDPQFYEVLLRTAESHSLRCSNSVLIETLTEEEFTSFKKLGGDTA